MPCSLVRTKAKVRPPPRFLQPSLRELLRSAERVGGGLTVNVCSKGASGNIASNRPKRKH